MVCARGEDIRLRCASEEEMTLPQVVPVPGVCSGAACRGSGTILLQWRSGWSWQAPRVVIVSF